MTDAAEYFADEEPDQIRAAYGITADTPDDDLPAIAKAIEHGEAAELSGVHEYTRSLRDSARDIERAGLQEMSVTIHRLVRNRRGSIRRIASWGDSAEDLADMAGVDLNVVSEMLSGPPSC